MRESKLLNVSWEDAKNLSINIATFIILFYNGKALKIEWSIDATV